MVVYLLSSLFPSLSQQTGHGPSSSGSQASFTQSLDPRYSGSHLQQASSPATAEDLDLNPEEDNMFARALRERKLRSVQTNDRSNPLVDR